MHLCCGRPSFCKGSVTAIIDEQSFAPRTMTGDQNVLVGKAALVAHCISASVSFVTCEFFPAHYPSSHGFIVFVFSIQRSKQACSRLWISCTIFTPLRKICDEIPRWNGSRIVSPELYLTTSLMWRRESGNVRVINTIFMRFLTQVGIVCVVVYPKVFLAVVLKIRLRRDEVLMRLHKDVKSTEHFMIIVKISVGRWSRSGAWSCWKWPFTISFMLIKAFYGCGKTYFDRMF